MIEAGVAEIFIDEKAFGSFNTATQKFYKVFVLYLADESDFVEELIYPLPCVEEKSLNGYFSSIKQSALQVCYNLTLRLQSL